MCHENANIFCVTVDYDLPLEEMVRGQYEWANSDIYLPSFATKHSGKVRVSIELVHFSKGMQTDDVFREFDERGLRHAEPHELLAFGVKYPNIQREFPIVALGACKRGDYDSIRAVSLTGNSDLRNVHVHKLPDAFGRTHRFAAVHT